MNRARFSLPAFGAEATYRPWGNRSELFAGFGGVEAWRPDNTIEPSRRDSTYNDEWLTQAWARARIALDKNRHLWLGATRRYVSNFGQGQQHWNTIAGDATYSFGH